jgi:mono/diheme cytochrome c family protein
VRQKRLIIGNGLWRFQRLFSACGGAKVFSVGPGIGFVDSHPSRDAVAEGWDTRWGLTANGQLERLSGLRRWRSGCGILIAGLGTAVSLGIGGCHSSRALTQQEAEGKHLYEVRCAHCHEDNDLALKKVPPDLRGMFDRKSLPSGAPATDDAVRRNVLVGRGLMPGFAGRFTEEQMAALLAYLHARDQGL